MFVVDREHIRELEEIENKLKEYGFDVQWIERRDDYGAMLNLSRGTQMIKLFVAITRREKHIEEELSELSKRVYGEKRPFSKELIEKASLEAMKEELKGLCFALQRIE